MERMDPSPVSPAEVWRTLRMYRGRIAVCVAAFVGLAFCVALVTPRKWQAGMTVWLVPQTIQREQQGEFGYEGDRKLSVQTQNFRQVALSDEVLWRVLQRVPAPSGAGTATKQQRIGGLRKQIAMESPKGTEFGKSEIMFVNIVDRDPDRALALAKALKDEASQRYKQLSVQKASNLVQQARGAADESRDELISTQQALSHLERKAGADLPDLRVLAGRQGAEVLLKRALVALEGERQRVEGETRERAARFDALREATTRTSDENLMALPVFVAEGRDDLRAARVQLVEIMGRLSRLASRYTDEHPEVLATRREAEEGRMRYRQALAAFIASQHGELIARQERLAFLKEKESEYRQRLTDMERMRIEYATAVDAVDQARVRIQDAQKRLASASEIAARAREAELLLFVDTPRVGDEPIGPGRRTHVAAGLVLGLLAGLGLAMLSRYSNMAAMPVPDSQIAVSSLRTPRQGRPLSPHTSRRTG